MNIMDPIGSPVNHVGGLLAALLVLPGFDLLFTADWPRSGSGQANHILLPGKQEPGLRQSLPASFRMYSELQYVNLGAVRQPYTTETQRKLVLREKNGSESREQVKME